MVAQVGFVLFDVSWPAAWLRDAIPEDKPWLMYASRTWLWIFAIDTVWSWSYTVAAWRKRQDSGSR